MSQAIKNALRLAHQGRMPLHQAIARSGYDDGGPVEGQPDESSQQAFLQDQLHPELRPSPLVEQMSGPTSQQAMAANQLNPKETAHEFVDQVLSKNEPQLPQMDRDAYNAIKYAAPEVLHAAAYATPAAPLAAAYDLYQGAESGNPMEMAFAATGLPGKTAKAAAMGAAALMPEEAQANPYRFLTNRGVLDIARRATEFARGVNPERRLMVTHSADVGNLDQSVNRWNALASPSLAVSHAQAAPVSFGDATLVGMPHLAVPSAENTIYAADAFTPRIPQISTPSWHQKEAADSARHLAAQYGEGAEGIADNMLKRGEIDQHAHAEIVRFIHNPHERDLKEFIYDPVKRQKLAPTLDNIVNQMHSGEIVGGEGGILAPATGLPVQKALAHKPFGSIEELMASRENLVPNENVGSGDWHNVRSQQKHMGDALAQYHVNPSNYKDADFNDAIVDYFKHGPEGLARHYRDLPPSKMQGIERYAEMVRALKPTYFEAKPRRGISFDEFGGALLPGTSSGEMVADKLVGAGLPKEGVKFYQHLRGRDPDPMRQKMLHDLFKEHTFADGGEVTPENKQPGDDAHEFVQQKLQSGEPQVPQYRENQDFPSYFEPSHAEAASFKPLAGIIGRGLGVASRIQRPVAYFEVAPGSKWNAELQKNWETLPESAKDSITNRAIGGYFNRWRRSEGIEGDLASGVGGFRPEGHTEGYTNPSKIFYLNDPKQMQRALGGIGELYGQDAMMGVSPRQFPGSFESGLITLGLPKGVGGSEVHDLYSNLLHKGLTEGHSTDLGTGAMSMMGGKNLSEAQKIAKDIASATGNKYDIGVREAHVAFPKAGVDYGQNYVLPEKSSRLAFPRSGSGGSASEPIKKEARGAVQRMVEEALRASNSSRVGKGRGGGILKLGSKIVPAAQKLFSEGSGYLSLPGKPSTVNLPGIGRVESRPIPQIEDVANKFIARQGNKPLTSFRPINPEYSGRVAQAFEEMPHDPNHPLVKRAYDALIQETMDQYKAAKDLGYDFRFIKPGQADPYAKSPALGYADLVTRGRGVFYPTEQGFGTLSEAAENNPLLTRVGRVGDLPNATANDAFRIVHDIYGHHGPGNPYFRGPGEERAYQLHSQMYSPEAVPAMAAETRGQNSWVNYGPHAEHNATASGADTIYADQKTGILPTWATALPPEAGEDVSNYIRSLGGKAKGGAIENALRLAKNTNRRRYATDGGVEMPGDREHEFVQSQLNPEQPPAPTFYEMDMRNKAKAINEANRDRPFSDPSQFVQHQLNKDEQQLPQMDREAYEAWKQGSTIPLRMAAYEIPYAGQALAAHDIAQAGKEFLSQPKDASGLERGANVFDLASSLAGARGKGLKALGMAAAPLMAGEAEAGPIDKAVRLGKTILTGGTKAAKTAAEQVPQYLLDIGSQAKEATKKLKGRTIYGEEAPLMFNGKQVHEFEPADWGAFGRQHGVESLGPESNEAFQQSLVPYTTKSGKTITVPGGIEDTEKPFTYYDLLHLKSQGIDPNDLEHDAHRMLHNRMMTTMSPEGPVGKERMFNQYLMGMISPNNPLTPNQFGVASMMAKEGGDDISRLANMTPWTLENMPPKAAQRTVRGPLSKNIATQFGLQAAGKGGLGAVGSPDYTRMSDLAKMFEKDPEFFRFKEGKEGGKTHAEDWMNFVTKIASAVPGLSAKTGSFATVWQNPKTADISAIDRHMASLLNDSLFANAKEKKDFEKKVVNYYNKGRDKKEQIKNYNDVIAAPGGRGAYVEQVMQHVNKHGAAKLRTPSGEIGKGVPEHLRDVNWPLEPEKVAKLSPGYLRALNENAADAARNKQGLFANQWMLWDRIRNRIEPHEVMFPGLEKLPRMAQSQLLNAMNAHRKAGYLRSPAQVKPVLNPSSLAHFGIAGAPAGAYLMGPSSKDEETPPET